jgi:type IV pilus biogenesis protein CpaD/CtpE
MRTTTITLATAAVLLTLAGCSSSNDDAAPTSSGTPAPSAPATSSQPTQPAPSTQPTTGDTAALEQAVAEYTDAYFAGKASTAHHMLSERCRGKINELLYGTVVKQAAKNYGPDHPATGIKAEVSGDMARVSYKIKGLPKLDQAQQPWVREGGAWKYDAC